MAQNAKTVQGLSIASVKTIQGLAAASVKTIMGVDNTGGSGGSGFTIIAQASGGSYPTLASTVTDPINTTGANIIWVAVADWESATATSVSDNYSNTYIMGASSAPTAGARCRIGYCYNPNVGVGHEFYAGDSITTTYPAIAVIAASGSASSPLDQQNGSFATTPSTIQAGSVTPSEGGEIIIAAVGHGSSTPTINGGFSSPKAEAYVPGNNFGVSISYLQQTTPVSANPTWSLDGTSDASARIATFKSA